MRSQPFQQPTRASFYVRAFRQVAEYIYDTYTYHVLHARILFIISSFRITSEIQRVACRFVERFCGLSSSPEVSPVLAIFPSLNVPALLKLPEYLNSGWRRRVRERRWTCNPIRSLTISRETRGTKIGARKSISPRVRAVVSCKRHESGSWFIFDAVFPYRLRVILRRVWSIMARDIMAHIVGQGVEFSSMLRTLEQLGQGSAWIRRNHRQTWNPRIECTRCRVSIRDQS